MNAAAQRLNDLLTGRHQPDPVAVAAAERWWPSYTSQQARLALTLLGDRR